VTGLFYNPDIHPYHEHLRRKQTLREYAGGILLNVVWPDGCPMEEFLRPVATGMKTDVFIIL